MNYDKLVKALRICHVVDCDDCVLKKECVESIIKGERPYVLLHNDAAAAIEALQAETVRLWPKRGKWVNSKERIRPDMCSVCGCVYEADRFMDKIAWNYCPNCGAKMEAQDG